MLELSLDVKSIFFFLETSASRVISQCLRSEVKVAMKMDLTNLPQSLKDQQLLQSTSHISVYLRRVSHLCSSLRNQGGAPQSRLMNFKRASDPSSTSKKKKSFNSSN